MRGLALLAPLSQRGHRAASSSSASLAGPGGDGASVNSTASSVLDTPLALLLLSPKGSRLLFSFYLGILFGRPIPIHNQSCS